MLWAKNASESSQTQQEIKVSTVLSTSEIDLALQKLAGWTRQKKSH